MNRNNKVSRKKIYRIIILLIGLSISGMLFIEDKKSQHLSENNDILRNEWKEGDYDIDLDISYNNLNDRIHFTVEERKYTDEELYMMLDEAICILEKKILGKNTSLQSVNLDLALPGRINGFPFEIFWKTDNDAVINSRGNILCEKNCNEIHDVIVSAVFVLDKFRYEHKISVRIVPNVLSDEENLYYDVRNKIREAFDNKSSKKISLPQTVNGYQITYREIGTNRSVLCIVVTIFLSVIVNYLIDYDEKVKDRKKQESLNKLYPVFVEKLKLYIVSGFSVKKAFFAIRNGMERVEKNDVLCSFLDILCNQYNNGMSEERILHEFGNKCGGSYKKLIMLLNVSIKQGNEKIVELLDNEEEKAFSKRKEIAKKMGDEASIKLLFPMILILIIIMILITFPVYIGIN